jgi:hypothetical protein
MSVVDVHAWVDTLMGRYADRDVTGSALFPLTERPNGADLDCKMVPLDRHPFDYLVSYRPPRGCVALGLVTAGWAAPIDSPVRPSAHPDAQRILQALVIAADGQEAARLRYADGRIVDPGQGGYGRVLDALRAAVRRR